MDIEMTFNGKTYTLPDDIDLDYKDGLIKLNLSRNDLSEGIWAVIHPKDLVDYENNVTDINYHRVCALANHAVCGIPWGAYVPYKLNGNSRPVAVFEEIIDAENDSIHYPEAVLAMYTEMENDKAEDNE